ncbi:DegT/DnrJ/EryC1/StrS family aminotransferase [Acidovorax sp. RAC01]|uniref:DegT/DnrJ/EryC1/StrS family aminotransferase n=1 Tax=Acidovorax sp. RAC01 TaxID=1842533 RepID=UPI00083E7A31|nr:DegT/DnrJ/EryC1/StrS aminotransferase family protein [Acidovorax sp. RAC01]AOG21911.1 degT/DnrJ/EryC1/StrS aminotransferase family protein [Acidovorax sp. RAC01]
MQPTAPIKPFFLDVDAADRAALHTALDQILDTSTLILGPYTDQFEKEFAAYVGTKHAVSLNTATSALEVQLRLEGVENRIVGVPTNTNFATVAAIIHAGGEPVFMDMDEKTFMPRLSHVEELLRAQPLLAGLMWVHIGGVISPDMAEIASFCKSNGLFLIEDCAHAHGSVLDGKHAGTFGVSGAFSFFPTKVMTTMEGGMIVTDDADYASAIRSYRNQGKRAGAYNALHVDLGSSWRLSEFGAAFGLRQLAKLDAMVARRAVVANIYVEAFKELGIQYVDFSHMTAASNYKVIAILPEHLTLAEAKDAFASEGVILGGGVYEIPCHSQPVFQTLDLCGSSFPIAEKYCGRQFCLPITSGMNHHEANRVVEAMRKIFSR